MRLILQKFGLAVGVVCTILLVLAWLAGTALAVAEYGLGQNAFVAGGVLTAIAVALFLAGWLIVFLWIWIFEP